MKHSTGSPTAAQLLRWAKLRELGCIACRLDGIRADGDAVEIHHMLSGNRRIGHDATIPLCAWHHQGVAFDETPSYWFLENVGPSYHKHRRAFRQRYGSDREILDTVNGLISSQPLGGN